MMGNEESISVCANSGAVEAFVLLRARSGRKQAGAHCKLSQPTTLAIVERQFSNATTNGVERISNSYSTWCEASNVKYIVGLERATARGTSGVKPRPVSGLEPGGLLPLLTAGYGPSLPCPSSLTPRWRTSPVRTVASGQWRLQQVGARSSRGFGSAANPCT